MHFVWSQSCESERLTVSITYFSCFRGDLKINSQHAVNLLDFFPKNSEKVTLSKYFAQLCCFFFVKGKYHCKSFKSSTMQRLHEWLKSIVLYYFCKTNSLIFHLQRNLKSSFKDYDKSVQICQMHMLKMIQYIFDDIVLITCL